MRFLESGEIRRVGAVHPHTRVNVRLITASNRDLPTQVTSGGFRQDLYIRLNAIHISLPPPRARSITTEDLAPEIVPTPARESAIA